jgi:hypothetical protein
LGQVKSDLKQTVEVAGRLVDRDVIDAALDLASVSVALTFDASSVNAAFGGSSLVDATDGVDVGVLRGDDMLASVTQFFFIPNNRFKDEAVFGEASLDASCRCGQLL